jgi:hypothetical protein
MRCRSDGTEIETLVSTGDPIDDRGDASRWCVGIAVDSVDGHVYWTQKGDSKSGTGRICRTGLNLRSAETPSSRSDIEILCSDLPEPIDLVLDTAGWCLYWTDRGAPPMGNTLNRAFLGAGTALELSRQVLADQFDEAIGLTVDYQRQRIYVADLSGSVYSFAMDGSDRRHILTNAGRFTGIAHFRPDPDRNICRK